MFSTSSKNVQANRGQSTTHYHLTEVSTTGSLQAESDLPVTCSALLLRLLCSYIHEGQQGYKRPGQEACKVKACQNPFSPASCSTQKVYQFPPRLHRELWVHSHIVSQSPLFCCFACANWEGGVAAAKEAGSSNLTPHPFAHSKRSIATINCQLRI